MEKRNIPEKKAVSLIIERDVYNNQEEEFIECVSILNNELRLNVGFAGLNKYLERGIEHSKHTIILHFTDQKYLHDYIESKIYIPVIERLDKISVNVVQRIEYGWFNVLSDGQLANKKPPPRYKVAVVTWGVVYGLVVLVAQLLSYLGLENKLPFPVSTARSNLIVVILMSYGGAMNFATKLFDFWINRNQ